MPSVRTSRRRVAGTTAGGLMAAAMLTGCGEAEPVARAEGTRTVGHAMGETAIAGTPERVVVLDTGELDATLALGVTPVGAVRTDVSDELPGFVAAAGVDPADITAVGTIAEPDLEAIAALQPDLILSNSVRHADVYDQLAQIAPTVFAEAIGESWQENLLVAGEALDRQEQAQELLDDYAARTEVVGDLYGDPARTEVSVGRFLDGTLLRLYGEGSFIGSVLADVGFARPEVQRTAETFVEVSPEQVSRADGDLLFHGAYGDQGAAAAAQVTAGALWQSIPAVAGGRAIAVDDDRWFLGLGPLGAGLVLDDLEDLAPRLTR